MIKDEIYEEVRSLLREPQVATVAKPFTYSSVDMVPQVRSALRHLRAKGLDISVTMDLTGAFDEDPTEAQGLLIALFVAHRLLSGDMLQKLRDGEMGIYFKAGSDVIDTKAASKSFESKAGEYLAEFNRLLAIQMANADGGASSIFGEQTPYMAG